MRTVGYSLVNPAIQMKRLPAKVYPNATGAEIKAQANANLVGAAMISQAAKGVGFGEPYLPSISQLSPGDRPSVLALAKSIRNDPAQAATIMFSGGDGKKVTSLDQYISDLQSAIDGAFAGAA